MTVVATATCTHCTMDIYQDQTATWRHSSDNTTSCLPTPPNAMPIPKTIRATCAVEGHSPEWAQPGGKCSRCGQWSPDA